MPHYEYLCPECNNEFDVKQSIKEEIGAKCPECSTWSTKRLIGKTSFALQGGGWAADNYSKANK